MLKNKVVKYLLVLVMVVFFYHCSSTNTTTSEMKIENKIWNTIDSELIVDSLIVEILNSRKIKEFEEKQKPVIIVGKIENLSNEEIDTSLLEKNLERDLLNSGKVTFITSKEKREKIRNNRKTRSNFSSKKKFGKYLKPLKSDLFIDGKFELTIDSLNTSVTKKYKLSVHIFNSKNYKLISTENVQIVK